MRRRCGDRVLQVAAGCLSNGSNLAFPRSLPNPPAIRRSLRRGRSSLGRAQLRDRRRLFHRAHREAAHEVALNKHREDYDRQRPDDAGRRHRGPVRADAAAQRACAARHGHGPRSRCQRESEQKFVEGRNHREDRRGCKFRRGQRKCNPGRKNS